MSISFACPECKVQIEVADEYAGHSGTCPRCQRVIEIPSGKQPLPTMVGAQTVPPRESARSKPRPADVDEPLARPRRPRAAALPKQPMGPIWPWFVGIFAAVVVVSLLISSFAVLVFWRKADPTRPAVQEFKGHGVTAGRLEGRRAMMQDGVFQTRTALHPNDPIDLDHPNSRAKVFDIQFIGGRDYVIELDSNQFDSELRLEDVGGPIITDFGNRGGRSARINWRPQFTDNYTVHVTNPNGGLGDFTVTIREANRIKPFVP